MPVFYILIVLGIIMLFFLISFAYKPIGKLGRRIFGDAIEIIEDKEEEEKNKEEKE